MPQRPTLGLKLLYKSGALIAGLLIVLTSTIDIADISDYSPLLEVGFGLWLTLIAGIGLVIAGIAGIVKRK